VPNFRFLESFLGTKFDKNMFFGPSEAPICALLIIGSKTIIFPNISLKVIQRLSTQIILRMNGSMPKIISK
jgi:hypothetical protein